MGEREPCWGERKSCALAFRKFRRCSASYCFILLQVVHRLLALLRSNAPPLPSFPLPFQDSESDDDFKPMYTLDDVRKDEVDLTEDAPPPSTSTSPKKKKAKTEESAKKVRVRQAFGSHSASNAPTPPSFLRSRPASVLQEIHPQKEGIEGKVSQENPRQTCQA